MNIIIVRHTTEDGARSDVHLMMNHFLVKFYNKEGVHMDASDVVCETLECALEAATPDGDVYQSHYAGGLL